jgi:D-serine deaminase-like pyridoxal phosphate-dependent protein
MTEEGSAIRTVGRLARYRHHLGLRKERVTTPALLLDLDAARRNCASMANRFRDLPADLRPHSKVHKSPRLAQLEVAAGAIGVAVATVWEAEVMVRAGIPDVLVANQVVHPSKVEALAQLAGEGRVTVTVDNVRNVLDLDRAVGRAGSRLEILIEVDVGMGRGGVRRAEDALPVAEAVASARHLKLRGLQGYEGHCMSETDPGRRTRMAEAANAKMIEVADLLATVGHGGLVLSGGGTGTYSVTGANSRIGEVQAGSYLLMDAFHERLVPGEFEPALTVLATVVSEHGNTIVLDAGRKAVGVDYVLPVLAAHPRGDTRFSEEHCVVRFPGRPQLGLGDTAEILPGYAPTTVNLHDVFHVVQDGVVVDLWPVAARGSGPPNW